MTRVAVLGATGQIGSHVLTQLAERSVQTRALTRDAARVRSIAPEDVELVEGDFRDDAVVRELLRDADSLLLLTPHGPSMGEAEIRIVRLARDTGARIVKISGTSAAIGPDSSDAGRQHWESERILSESGQPFVIVRPNAFMQTLVGRVVAPGLRAAGAVMNPLATAGVSTVDCRDIAAVAVVALIDESHVGSTFVVTGPYAVTFVDIARAIGDLTGREVPVIDVTPADAKKGALERGADPWEAAHAEAALELLRDGRSAYVTDDVERVTGAAPRTVEEYLAENLAVFTADARVSSLD